MPDTPKHSVSVAGIVVDDQDRVLVIQRRDNGHWEPPGGVLELDETPQEGVCREVREETGLEIAVHALTGVYKNMARGIVALVFRCSPVSGEAVLSDETEAVRWASLEDIEQLMSEVYLVRVKDAFDAYPSTRAHDGTRVVDAMRN